MQLFLISFVILFLELAFIRFLPAHVRLLGYFANTVLLASFLGMSAGCLTARRKTDLIHSVPALMLVTTLLTAGLWGLANFGRADVFLPPELQESLTYFNDTRASASLKLPLELVLPVGFALVALIFVGLGQVMGREFDRHPPLLAYLINVAGSLLGVGVFTLMSFCSVAAVWWFGLGSLLLCWWLRGPRWRFVGNVLLLALSVGTVYLLDGLTQSPSGDAGTKWSPYYKVRYVLQENEAVRLSISVNDMGHQCAGTVARKPTWYSLPFALLSPTGWRPDKALVIGAGSGNDVAAALQHGATEVEGVEIDPFILELGQRYHPDHPYQDSRVRLFNDDGRAFVRRSREKYDVAVYALVDSLTLMSTYSRVRLETYLFTLEAFRDVKAHLTDDGVFVIYNFFRAQWLIVRIAQMLEEVFGEEPLVFTFPPRDISLSDRGSPGFCILMAGNVEPLRRRFAEGQVYLLNKNGPANGGHLGAFAGAAPDPLPEGTTTIAPVAYEKVHDPLLPTDNWPFLYLRDKAAPPYLLSCMALILAVSFLLLRAFGGADLRGRFSPHFFFLGAAFMLLETRSVTTLALLHGTTWQVNAIVFFSILAMIVLANLYVRRRPTERFGSLYALLIAALALNFFLPPQSFLGLGALVRTILPPVVVFLPILLAALVFANSFRTSRQPSADIGWNIAGVMVGGLCENLSLVIGCQHLLLVVIVFYALSALSGRARLGASTGAGHEAGTPPRFSDTAP